jgi:hypothetical protein
LTLKDSFFYRFCTAEPSVDVSIAFYESVARM